jgi:hypothetical protein
MEKGRGILMTKIDKFVEIEFKEALRSWEAPCYWCGKIHRKANPDYRVYGGGRVHINIEHEPKYFCSEECKNLWIYHKQVFGDHLP